MRDSMYKNALEEAERQKAERRHKAYGEMAD